jgi:hypothetical protein
MVGGQAEPPMTVRLSVEKRSWLLWTWASSPSQTVGTPAANVTPSDSNSSNSDLPSSWGPGNTSLDPESGPLKGMPQALTWNIGTTGRMASRAEEAMASGSEAA